jgi:glycosyltransferase involved in cell wall biosynthesis
VKILFIGFWGFEDPLTTSTTLPNLEILSQSVEVEHIRLATVERDGRAPTFKLPFVTDKISFQPLVSGRRRSLLATKIEEFLRFPKELTAMALEIGATHIIGRGAMAGALAYLTSQRTNLPFYVESFEPHADYMLDSGVWSRYDPRYVFQRFWEEKEKRNAKGLMPVAENYRQQLLREGRAATKVVTVPCPVNLASFSYQRQIGQQVRQRLEFGADAIVGVYLGKFGDIYYDQEAFDLFRTAACFFGTRFRLIILTPHPAEEVKAKLTRVGFTESQYFVTKSPHHEVPSYLSAADFAFAPIKPAPCRQYCSPVKVGEYWACGLPVLLTEGVGDDSDIIRQEPAGGAGFDLSVPGSVAIAITRIAAQIQVPDYRAQARALAVKHRSVDRSREAYQQLLGIHSREIAAAT